MAVYTMLRVDGVSPKFIFLLLFAGQAVRPCSQILYYYWKRRIAQRSRYRTPVIMQVRLQSATGMHLEAHPLTSVLTGGLAAAGWDVARVLALTVQVLQDSATGPRVCMQFWRHDDPHLVHAECGGPTSS